MFYALLPTNSIVITPQELILLRQGSGPETITAIPTFKRVFNFLDFVYNGTEKTGQRGETLIRTSYNKALNLPIGEASLATRSA